MRVELGELLAFEEADGLVAARVLARRVAAVVAALGPPRDFPTTIGREGNEGHKEQENKSHRDLYTYSGRELMYNNAWGFTQCECSMVSFF